MSKKSGKVRRTDRYRYLVADPDEAREAVAEARLAEIRARGTDGHADAERALRDAEAAVKACEATIVLQALAPALQQDFDQEMVEQQEAREAQMKPAREAAEEAGEDPPEPEPYEESWTADSLEVRFLAACDRNPDHTAKWWAAEFAGDDWAIHERRDLLTRCYRVNMPPGAFNLGVLGKDWAQTAT